MCESGKYIDRVLSYLNDNVEYALLRNYDGLPYSNSSRDIDIVIRRDEYRRCKESIIDILTQDGWRIFSYLNNGRLITFVMAKLVESNIHLVQWDFFTDTSVHGIRLLSAEEMLASRRYNGTLYHVSKEYEFLDKYLYNRAVGADYPTRYASLKSEVKDSDIVINKLTKLFGSGDVDIIDKRPKLLCSLFRRQLLRSPFLTLSRVISSITKYLISYLSRDVAPTLAFTGADGVGKSTIIETIKQKMSSVYGRATQTFHFRPTLIANLGEVAHSVGVKREVDREYSSPHRGRKSSLLSSIARLYYYTFDYRLGYLLKVKPHSRITKLVIFDRYYSDVIVDSRRSSIYLGSKFLYRWGRLFIPKMRYNFLITADPDIILSRKQELNRDAIELINSKMEYLATKRGYYLILNNGSVDKVITNIFDIIMEKQHNRLIRRL